MGLQWFHLHNPKGYSKTNTQIPYQCVFPSGTIPQSHTIISSSCEEVEAIASETETVRSAIMSCVHW